MIPKTIHYCWFGPNKIPEKINAYIENWKLECPEYDFVLWNEDNFDVGMNDYVQQAYEAKKWAFVSDVARLYALKSHGGVYLDTDVELVSNFDEFLNCRAFIGTERLKKNGKAQLSTAVIGSVKNGIWVTSMLEKYKNRVFINTDESLDLTPNTTFLTLSTYNMLEIEDRNIASNDLNVFSSSYFSPKDFFTSKLNVTENTVAIHHFEGGWLPITIKIKIAVRRFLVRMFK